MRMNVADEKHRRTCSSYRTDRHVWVRGQFQHFTNTDSRNATAAAAATACVGSDARRRRAYDLDHHFRLFTLDLRRRIGQLRADGECWTWRNDGAL